VEETVAEDSNRAVPDSKCTEQHARGKISGTLIARSGISRAVDFIQLIIPD